MTAQSIQAKVARILNNTDLALNRGSDDGVEEGMKFAILSDTREEIRDPDNNELLDSIPVAKTVVKIIRAAPRSSIGRTFRTYESAGIFNALGQASTRRETLTTDEARVQRELDPEKGKIKVGDVAVGYTGEYTGILYEF